MDPDSVDPIDQSLLRQVADMAGYESYTYSDIIGSWNHNITTTVNNVGSYLTNITNLNIFQSCMNGVDQMGEMTYQVEQSLETTLSEMLQNQTPSEMVGEIARSLKMNRSENRTHNNTDVKVQIDQDGKIHQIRVKYFGNSVYVKVPIDDGSNPPYIQNILDTYFYRRNDGDDYFVGGCLFSDLSKYYEKSRNNHLPSWFEDRVEWVKFSYSGQKGGMIPCGFKKFENFDETPEEEY